MLNTVYSHPYLESYLLSYDALAFHAYLETIIAANSVNAVTGAPRQHQSPWLFMDAANTIFQNAKRRCYLSTSTNDRRQAVGTSAEIIDLVDEEDWAALDDLEGHKTTESSVNPRKGNANWIPKGMEPVLEELPKWSLLSDVLLEVEEEMIRLQSKFGFCMLCSAHRNDLSLM